MITERDRAKTLDLRQSVPAARTEGLVTTSTDDEVLVYDQQRHHIHHLNQSAAVIWGLCDGQRSVAHIAAAASEQEAGPVDADAVRLAIDKLGDANLLAEATPNSIRLSAQSRRTFMKRAAVAGAVAVPAIVSMTAPAMAAGSKACGSLCNPGGHGSNGNCPGAGIGYECNHCWKDGVVKPGFGNGDCYNTDYSGSCYCGCPPTQLVNGLCATPTSPPPPPPPPSGIKSNSLVNSAPIQQNLADTTNGGQSIDATQPPAPQGTQPSAPEETQVPVVQQSADQSQGDSAPADVPSPTPTDTPPPPPPPAALVNNAPVNNAPIGGNPANIPSTFVANPNGDGNGNSGNGGD